MNGCDKKEWHAIARGELASRLGQKVAEIAAILQNTEEPRGAPGLMGGKAGIVLFLSYFSRYSGNESFADRTCELFSEIFDMVNAGFHHPTFSAGLAGIGWTFEHIVRSEFFQADADEVLSEIDPSLDEAMAAVMEQGNFDLLHGALGILLFFMRRRSEALAGRAHLLLSELESRAESVGMGLRWASVIDIQTGHKGYELGLAHGQAGIIDMMARLKQRGMAADSSERIMNKAAAFLFAQAGKSAGQADYFPDIVTAELPQPIYNDRLAWCRGNLGIAASLLHAASISANREWETIALEALNGCLKRSDLEKAGICDAGLCHGTAGAAHIYNRIYQQTGISDFKEAALHWFEQTLNLAKFPDGYAGYKAYRSQKHGRIADPGFLEGVAGIGLAFLAAISPIAPDWDEALLLS